VSVGAVAASRGVAGLSRRLDRLSERSFALLVSVPSLILLAVIVLPPTLAVFGLSTFRIELGKDEIVRNVGLFNYLTRLPGDQEILDAIPRTLVFAGLSTLVTVPLALVTALILNRGFRGSGAYVMCVLLPWAIAPVATGVFWRYLVDSHFGIVDGVLVGFGLISEPINWLQDTGQAIAIATIAQAWRSAPLLAVLLVAALKTIPRTLYRAAAMDGADSWQAFRHITLPAIRPTLVVVAILQIIVSLQVFDLMFSLTNGGPGRSTYVLIYAIYDLAFGSLSLGYASAITVVLFGIIVLCSLVLLLFQWRRRGTSTGPIDDDPGLEAAGTSSLRFASATRFEHVEPPAPRAIRVPPVVGRVVFAAGALLLLFFFVAPIAWMAIASLQTDDQLSNLPPQLTATLYLDGYVRILQDHNWQGSLVVSLANALGTTFFVLLFASPVAYSLARFNLPGKNAILAILIFLQMVPAIVMAIPVLKVFQFLHLTDSVAGLVIVNTAFWLPLVVWLLRNFFAEVPVALERAARIDGCSRLGTLFRVTVPAARPGIAAAAVLILIGTWNEFLFAVILGNHNAVTITRLITSVEALPTRTIEESLPPNLLAAGAMVAVIPCLLLVVAFHRRIITGLTEGLVKG
jgi:multiple sugar transport system permease protein